MGSKSSGWFRTDYSKFNFDEINKSYNVENKNLYELANTYKVSIDTIRKVLKKFKIKQRDMKMETHASWKGGSVLRNGYLFERVKNHPRATKNGYVAVHLLVMENKLGKKILGKQPIHHIDFDKLNNSVENLWLCEDEKEHRNIHCSLDYVARDLFKKGIIKFKDGKYYV